MTRRGRPRFVLVHGFVTVGILVISASCKNGGEPSSVVVAPEVRPEKSILATTQRPTQPGSPQTGVAGNGTEVTPRVGIPEVAQQLTEAFANAAGAIRPSVVRIDVEIGRGRSRAAAGQERPRTPDGRDFFERFFEFGPGVPAPRPTRGTGSGVIFDSAGHVITNSHVVERAGRVTITLPDGQAFEGQVVGTDPHTDVGVVRFAQRRPQLVLARLGNANELRVGEWVLAVGSPLRLAQSVTAGIVSGLGQTGQEVRLSGERVRRYIQTDASINPGNSGGPLVNLAGEVVGINTMINVGPGGAYGFAIPVDQVAEVARTLIRDGRVRYPYIGVRIGNVADLSEEARRELGTKLPERGAVVSEVMAGGPAAEAGLQPGDIITAMGGKPVTTAADVIQFISSQPIGNKVPLEFVRQGRTRTVQVTLRELPSPEAQSQAESRIGAVLQTLTEPMARLLGVPPSTRGAVVVDVQTDSPADRAGLRPGDVIIEVDRKAVASAEAAATALQKQDGKTRLLRVRNIEGTRYVTITFD